MSTPPITIRREVLHRAIQDRVKQYIAERGFQAGDPLPAEAELARQLGISRASLREAIRSLQTFGVVESRHGTGTFVGRFSFEPLTDGLVFHLGIDRQGEGVGNELHELVSIREVLESSLVARLATVYGAEEISTLYELAGEMERLAAMGELFTEIDWQFHEMLYRPANNRWLLQLLESFWTVFYRVRESPPAPHHLQATARHHRKIVDALAAKDGPAAGRAMAIHFSGILEWISERGGNASLIGNPLHGDGLALPGTECP